MTTLIKNVSFAILDVETTGFFHFSGDRICEIGILRIKDGKEEGTYNSLINPLRPIPVPVSQITGITDDMVKNSRTFSEAAEDIMAIIKDAVIVCHNAPFDLGFINSHLKQTGLPALDNPVIDTLVLARRYFKFPGNALGEIARYLDLRHNDKHRAMGDVLVTRLIFEHFLDEFKTVNSLDTLEELLDMQGDSFKFEDAGDFQVPPIIREALKNKSTLKITYRSKTGVERVREIKPIEVTRYKSSAYIVAFCNASMANRTFRLDRIIRMQLI